MVVISNYEDKIAPSKYKLSSSVKYSPIKSDSSIDSVSSEINSMDKSTLKHLTHCVCFFTLIVLVSVNSISSATNNQIDPITEYGIPLTIVLYILRFINLLAVPQALFNLIGLTIYNAFEGPVDLKVNPMTAPFICIRVVTRGNFPTLVAASVDRNLRVCEKVGLVNYIIEVVTDNELNLMSHPRLRQVVVPSSYMTSTGARFKARALQYVLEDHVNTLGPEDWIVHLDEETLLTTDSLKGILNFVSRNKHEFGQGLITYTNEPIINYITTLVDSYRVADDMGKVRFQFSMFFRPVFSWKGSYVVSKYKAEKDVSFDHGPEGSIAEDCYFSMVAWSKSYTFQFIDGEMLEKSPFTIRDYLHQRKRWLQGILLVVHSPKIPFVYKWFLAIALYSRITIPVGTVNVMLSAFYPLPVDPSLYIIIISFGVNIYMFIFGIVKSLKFRQVGLLMYIAYLFGAVFLAIPFVLITENFVVAWGLLSHKYNFHVVQKEIGTSDDSSETIEDLTCTLLLERRSFVSILSSVLVQRN